MTPLASVRSAGCAGSDLAYWDQGGVHSTVELEPGSHTIAAVFVNGVRMRAVFDTGAASSLITETAARRAGLDLKARDIAPIFGIGPGRTRSWVAPTASLRIGSEVLPAALLRVVEAALGGADMLIGIDFFLTHHVYVATERGRLYFTANRP